MAAFETLLHRLKSRAFCIFSAFSLSITCSAALAQNVSTEVLSEVASGSLADILDASAPLQFVPSGETLFAGNYLAARLTQFDVTTTGELSLNGVVELADLGAALTSVRHMATNNSGTYLYATGEHRLAVFGYDSSTNALNLVVELLVDPALSIVDLVLSGDNNHLYIVSNNYSFDSNSGASALTRYNINSATGVPSLVATRNEPVSAAPLSGLTLADEGDLAFVNSREHLEVSRRNSSSGELSLLAVNDNVSGGVVTRNGDWLFESKNGEFNAYRVDGLNGTLTRTQQFRQTIPPLRRFDAVVEGDIALNANEDRLFTTGQQLVGTLSGVARVIRSSDVFVRDRVTGLIRRDGSAARSGSTMVRHPANDWFYTFVPSYPQGFNFPRSVPVVTQQALVPPLSETRIIAAVLPGSRSEGVPDQGVTAFATVLNIGNSDAVGCNAGILKDPTTELNFRAFALDPITNEPMGAGASVFAVPAGGATNLILDFNTDPNDQEFTRAPQLLDMRFFCDNTPMSDRVTGVTTFGFASDDTGLPDLLVATASPDRPGIVTLPTATGQSFFTVATINLGSDGLINATGAAELAGSIVGAEPLTDPAAVRLLICETDPDTSQCKAPFADQVERTIAENEIVTYTVIVQGLGSEIAFQPEIKRAFVLFQDSDGHLRGSSSVAVETQ